MTPRLIVLVAAVANEAERLDFPVYITSGTDGRHMVGSKHYSGEAIDVRSYNFPSRQGVVAFAEKLRLRLGKDYDVVVEHDHIHLEYDPK